jgi:hypothetical protein
VTETERRFEVVLDGLFEPGEGVSGEEAALIEAELPELLRLMQALTETEEE